MTAAAAGTAVRLETDGAVATIIIDRPQVRNAIDRARVESAPDEIDAPTDVRAAVLTGAGGFFSAGMDLKAFSATKGRPVGDTRRAFGIVERSSETPLVAAVEGRALGGGLEIALARYLRLHAGRDAMVAEVGPGVGLLDAPAARA